MKPQMRSVMVYFSATDSVCYFNDLPAIKEVSVNTLTLIEEYYFMLHKWREILLSRQGFISTEAPRIQLEIPSFKWFQTVYKCNFYLWFKYALWPAGLIVQVDKPLERKVSNFLCVFLSQDVIFREQKQAGDEVLLKWY